MILYPIDYLNWAVTEFVRFTIARGCNEILNNKRFQTWPASTSKHHVYTGGLATHCAEVLRNCLATNSGTPVDMEILTVATIFHDFHKIEEYEEVFDGGWEKTEYAEKVGHIAGGYGEFCRLCPREEVGPELHDQISHVLLSHHGRLDWESLKEPASKEAYVFHWSDMLSAFYGPGAQRQ